jgi:hypothetical protein
MMRPTMRPTARNAETVPERVVRKSDSATGADRSMLARPRKTLGGPSPRHHECVSHRVTVIASPRRGRGDPALDCFAPAGRSQ